MSDEVPDKFGRNQRCLNHPTWWNCMVNGNKVTIVDEV